MIYPKHIDKCLTYHAQEVDGINLEDDRPLWMIMHNTYNPDVLTCLANLSSDEVFTPPKIVNQILQELPPALFSNKETKFLDPCIKSGVFLREIAKRLLEGLESQIPNLEQRIEHIFSKQLFGIATTELTSLIARRTTYCSKKADGVFSVVRSLASPSGNIVHNPANHTWQNGKCIF